MGRPPHLDLFPLPLVPFERYMLADDRPGYPMTGVVQFHFRGSPQRLPWESAFARAIERQPLMTSLLGSEMAWRGSDVSAPALMHWDTWGDELCLPAGEPIDLTHTPGVRVWTQQRAREMRVTVQVHHATTDALGIIGLVVDWVRAYEAGLAGNQRGPLWRQVDPMCLRTRGHPRWRLPPESVSRWQAIREMLSEATGWFMRRPAPLRPQGLRAGCLGQFPGLRYHTFTSDTTSALLRQAKSAGGKMNDLLLLALFRTLADWNERDGRTVERDCLQINLPTSLRLPEDAAMPAANVMGYAFIHRRPHECRDPISLLSSIIHETRAIREWNLGQRFLDGLGMVERIPGLLRWMVASGRCFATAILSNLGDVTRLFIGARNAGPGGASVADLTLERVVGSPPLRPGTRAAFLAASCHGRLTVSLRCDGHYLDEAAADELLALFVAKLESSASP